MRANKLCATDRPYANFPNLDLDSLRSEEKEAQPCRNVTGIPKKKKKKKIKPRNEEGSKGEKQNYILLRGTHMHTHT